MPIENEDEIEALQRKVFFYQALIRDLQPFAKFDFWHDLQTEDFPIRRILNTYEQNIEKYSTGLKAPESEEFKKEILFYQTKIQQIKTINPNLRVDSMLDSLSGELNQLNAELAAAAQVKNQALEKPESITITENKTQQVPKITPPVKPVSEYMDAWWLNFTKEELEKKQRGNREYSATLNGLRGYINPIFSIPYKPRGKTPWPFLSDEIKKRDIAQIVLTKMQGSDPDNLKQMKELKALISQSIKDNADVTGFRFRDMGGLNRGLKQGLAMVNNQITKIEILQNKNHAVIEQKQKETPNYVRIIQDLQSYIGQLEDPRSQKGKKLYSKKVLFIFESDQIQKRDIAQDLVNKLSKADPGNLEEMKALKATFEKAIDDNIKATGFRLFRKGGDLNYYLKEGLKMVNDQMVTFKTDIKKGGPKLGGKNE